MGGIGLEVAIIGGHVAYSGAGVGRGRRKRKERGESRAVRCT